ncbi:hypothetical protein FDP41_007476 [Naegleria fowleri]|uniref:Ribosomal protein L11 C-terminal domain-containing protein n=1 Tax=Naegleria fowleri TaxID=5763 RepID=A0A6A5CG77_NAEFO|nr:uncharacterized protein FDP41_007476 [Naegleria fowleri]KAF0984299.1 hypothetical protein FDP41_007476 [Naegleria fowleri]CAG4713209.1 unnamed protein product [Naegleria fowleri]
MIENNKSKIIHVQVIGCQAQFTSYSAVLAPKIGPLGLSPRLVAHEIMHLTKEWKDVRVKCKIVVNLDERKFQVEVIPSCASYIIRALMKSNSIFSSMPFNNRHTRHSLIKAYKQCNLTMDQVVEIARCMRSRSRAKEFKGCVIEVLGTCVSVGCKVENQDPRHVQQLLLFGFLSVPVE